MARVRATAMGFDGIVLRQPGEEFDFNGAPGSWFEYLDPKDRGAAEAAYAKRLAEAQRASITEEVRAQEVARIRAEVIAAERAKIEAEVRFQIRAERDAGKSDGGDGLV